MSKTITKADIVQRLLDSKHISAEEAVVLLMNHDYQLERKDRLWSIPAPWFGMPMDTNPYTIKASTDNNKNKYDK
jgi:hypothetical protein